MEVKSNFIKNSVTEFKGSKRKIKSSSGNVLDSPCANTELELSNENYFHFGKSILENKKVNKIQSKTKRSGYSILPHICHNCEQHCEANDVPESSQGNCYCSSCIECSDTETMDSVSEWQSLSGVVQGVLSMQSDCLQNVPLIKAQVLKMCIMDSPNLFKSLAKVSKEAVIDMKVQVMKRLVKHSLESRQNFLSTLLLKYQSLCAACEILADILSPLVDEYLKLFHITWQLFGKHLYNRIIFNDPVMQKFFHKALNHIRKVLSSSNDEEVQPSKDDSPKGHQVNKLDDNTIIIHNTTANNNSNNLDEKEYTRLLVDCESFLLEMKKVEEAWKPSQRLLEEYDHKQAQMQLNEQLWRDDYHFFMSQRRLLQQLVHKTSASADCSKQLEQFSQMFKHKNKEYSCPTCRNFKCSYNESGMSHLITCGLINPDVTPIDEDDVEDDGGEDKDEEGVDHNEIDLFTTDAEKLQAYLEMMRPEVYKERTSSSSSSSCSTSSLLDGISSLKLPQFDETKKNGTTKSEEEDDDDDDDDFHDAQQMHYIDFTYPYSAVDKDGNKIEIDPDTLPTLSELEAKTLNTYKSPDKYLIKHTNETTDKALKAECLTDQEYSKSSMQFVKLLFRNQQKKQDEANKACSKNDSKFLLPSLIQQQQQQNNNYDNTLKLCLKEKNLSDILSNNNHLLMNNIGRDIVDNKVNNDTPLTPQKNHFDRESSSFDYDNDTVNHVCKVVNNFEHCQQNGEDQDKQSKQQQLLKKQPSIDAPHKHLYKIYKQRSKQQTCNSKKVIETKNESQQLVPQTKPTSCKNSCEKSKEDCGNTNDKVNSQKNHCECWHCEFFGHDTPSTAPVSKNFTECRDRLRQKLKKKKGHSCLNTTTMISKTTTTFSSTTTTITTSTTTTSISTKKSNCSNFKDAKSSVNKTAKMANSSSMEDLLKFINGLDARIEMNEGKEKKGKKNKNKKLNKIQDKSNDHLLSKNTAYNNENNDINNNIYNNAFNDINKNAKNFSIDSLSDHADSKDLLRKYKDMMCQENSIRVVQNSKDILTNNISLHGDQLCRNNIDKSKCLLKKNKPLFTTDKTNAKEASKPHINGFNDKHQASTDVLKHDCNVNPAKPTLLLDRAFVSSPLSPKKSYNATEIDRSRNFKQESNRISSLSPMSTSLPPPPSSSSTLTASPSSKNKRNKKRNKIEVNDLIEEVFKPCKEDVGDYDREIEDFKRFCFNAPSYPAKEKVNLNMKDIFNRRRIANHI